MLELSHDLSVELEVCVRYDLQRNPRRLSVVRRLHIQCTINLALSSSFCFFTFICSNSSFLRASSFSQFLLFLL